MRRLIRAIPGAHPMGAFGVQICSRQICRHRPNVPYKWRILSWSFGETVQGQKGRMDSKHALACFAPPGSLCSVSTRWRELIEPAEVDSRHPWRSPHGRLRRPNLFQTNLSSTPERAIQKKPRPFGELGKDGAGKRGRMDSKHALACFAPPGSLCSVSTRWRELIEPAEVLTSTNGPYKKSPILAEGAFFVWRAREDSNLRPPGS